MKLSIIVAIAKNGVIGGNNGLLWHIPEDLKHFKKITSGHSIIMGRKTFESIGKPLPHRRNIVVTRNPSFNADGIEIANSLDKALDLVRDESEVFIIGGGEIYKQALPIADKLYVTRVHESYEGDTYFPPISPDEWQLISSDKQSPTDGPGFTFEEYKRKQD